MKRLLLSFLFCLLFIFSPVASPSRQIPVDTAKMRVLTEYCRKQCLEEKFADLIVSSKKGVSQSVGNNRYSSVFYYYGGLGYEYSTRQDSLAIDCYEKSLAFAKKADDMEQVGNVIRRLYYLYYLYKMDSRANSLLSYVKSRVNTIHNWEVKANFLVCICNSYLFHDEYEQFINYAFQTIDLYKKKLEKSRKNNRNIANLYRNIVSAYIQMMQYDKALEYCKVAEGYGMQEPINLAYLYGYKIKIYSSLGRVDSVEKYIQKIENLENCYFEKQSCLGESYGSLSENYLQINRLPEALATVEKALRAGSLSKNHEVVTEAMTIKGKILFAMHQYKPALSLLLSIEKDAKMYDKWNYTEMLNVIAQCYKLTGNTDRAFRYMEAYSLQKDTILKETAKKNIANAEAHYQTKEKQQRINTLVSQNKIALLEQKQIRFKLLVLILLVIIAVLVGGAFFIQSRNRKKANQQLRVLNNQLDEANRVKMRFFGILNHDLRSPLSNLIQILDFKNEEAESVDAATIQKLETNAVNSARNLLASMEDMLLWGKGQMNNFNPQMSQVSVEDLFRYIAVYFETEKEVKFSFDNADSVVLTTDENILKTILRNLTSNAIKALRGREHQAITWTAATEKGRVSLTIADNGPGISADQLKALYDENQVVGVKNGLGLHLIRDLCSLIDCTVTMVDSTKDGTVFKLIFSR